MCGVIGTFNKVPGGLDKDVERLSKINHRGHEAVGLAASGSEFVTAFRRKGLVRSACTDDVNQWREFTKSFGKHECDKVLGHTRYSTVGNSDIGLAQPIEMDNPIDLGGFGKLYLGHVGQYPFYLKLKRELEEKGHRFRTDSSDSDVLAAYLASLKVDKLSEAVFRLVERVEGAFSILAISSEELVAARDRYGVRPLWYEKGDSVYFSSETGALPNAAKAQAVAPGSVVVATRNGQGIEASTHQVISSRKRAHCILEVLYFSRPDQRIGASDCAAIRRMLGRNLAKTFSVDADVVCGVPDSGIPSAVGYAEEAGIMFDPCAILRNFYSVSGRSFILPGQSNRSSAARRKYSVSPAAVCGKRVVVVDDTIVRATTISVIVKMMYAAGAKEVHVRIPAAPVVGRCYLGIDIRSRDELPAAMMSVDEVNRRIVKANSLKYLPLVSMVNTCNAFHEGWCSGCFGGKYAFNCPKE